MPNKDIRQAILESISEAKLRDEMVIPLIKTLGLHYYFTYDSRHSLEGFTDLVVWHNKIIFRELKTEKGVLSLKQVADYIFVINKDGYIGESTAREIAYAKSHNKPIEYLEAVQ